jgi:hypothetical protein
VCYLLVPTRPAGLYAGELAYYTRLGRCNTIQGPYEGGARLCACIQSTYCSRWVSRHTSTMILSSDRHGKSVPVDRLSIIQLNLPELLSLGESTIATRSKPLSDLNDVRTIRLNLCCMPPTADFGGHSFRGAQPGCVRPTACPCGIADSPELNSSAAVAS